MNASLHQDKFSVPLRPKGIQLKRGSECSSNMFAWLLVDQLAGLFDGWLARLLACLFGCLFVGWFVSWLVCWLGLMVGWLYFCLLVG